MLERIDGIFPGQPIAPSIRVSETERVQSIGVGVLIIALDPRRNGDNVSNPKFWTIRERQSKGTTIKLAGEISGPAETKKTGESTLSNIYGALGEFCDDTSIDEVSGHLFAMEGSFVPNAATVHGNPVDLAVLVYDGLLDTPFKPASCDEVSANGWMTREDILKIPNVRPVFRDLLEFERRNGLAAKILEAYYTNPQMRTPVFPQGFSLNDFHVQREQLADDPRTK